MMMVWLKATCIADEYAPPTTVGQDSGPDAITLAGMIHDENPFIDSPDQRDPIRRFRGRLTAPVTIVTSGPPEQRVGLTVSSLNVIEGDPGSIQMVVGPTSDLWSSVAGTGRFVAE